jgi:hypothetical protein
MAANKQAKPGPKSGQQKIVRLSSPAGGKGPVQRSIISAQCPGDCDSLTVRTGGRSNIAKYTIIIK